MGGGENGDIILRLGCPVERDDLDGLQAVGFIIEEVYLLYEIIGSVGVVGSIGAADDHPALVLPERVGEEGVEGVDGLVLVGIFIQLVQLAVGDAVLEGLGIRGDRPPRGQDDRLRASLTDKFVYRIKQEPRFAIFAGNETCSKGLIGEAVEGRGKLRLEVCQGYLSDDPEYAELVLEE